jgi:hypothetical protein
MLYIYFREVFTSAARSSWKAANGIAGAAIAGFGLIWPGIWKFTSRVDWWADATDWIGSFLIYAGIAWIIIFVVHLVFLAPFQLWRVENDRSVALAENGQPSNDRAQKVIEHDRKLAARIREIFPENQKQKLVSDLINEHAYLDVQGNRLGDAVNFLNAAETHFLDDVLENCAKALADAGTELLQFLGLKFFIYPREQRQSPIRYVMQPNWNIDREGSGSEEQMEKYDALTTDLDRKVAEMSARYDQLIKSFHAQLFE